MKFTIAIESPSRMSRRARLFGIVLIVLCLIATGGFWYVLDQANQRDVTNKINANADQIVSIFEKRTEVYTDTLYGARGIFQLNRSLTQNDWQTYMEGQSIFERYPGLTSVLYARADTVEGDASAILTYAAPREFYQYSGTRIENAALKTALRQAATAGGTVLSAPFQTRVNSDRDDRVSIILALYDKTYNPEATDLEKQAAVQGYVIATLRPRLIFDEATTTLGYTRDLRIRITDQNNRELYTNGQYTNNNARITREQTVAVGGAVWRISFSAPRDYMLTGVERYAPLMLVTGGTVFMILLAGLYFYRRGVQIRIVRGIKTAKSKR